MRILLLILFPIISFAQVNIKGYGAKESYADNSSYIQKAIDVCVKTGSTLIIPKGNWRVGKPLVVARWDSTEKIYRQAFIKIQGESTFWDRGDRSVLIATFGDAPLLSFHLNKGSIIDGVALQGQWKRPGSPYMTNLNEYRDTTTRDSRWSPYCAIAVDPFMYKHPEDGGYPPLAIWYRGSESRGGSTGLIFRNISINGFTIGAITSPNGYTQNAELITFENIQIANCKIGIAGCQAQEKLNRVINLGAWGTTHTVFCWNEYGERTPGHWVIDGVNVAGEVNQIINRHSSGWFPLFMSNIYAESIFQFGYWQSYVGDRLSNSVIDFGHPESFGQLPKAQYEGGGVTLTNVLTRYYGHDFPIAFMGNKKNEKGWFTLENVKITESFAVEPTIIQGYVYHLPEGVKDEDCFWGDVKDGQIVGNVKEGKYAIFLWGDNTYMGYAIMEGTRIKWRSISVPDGYYKIVVK